MRFSRQRVGIIFLTFGGESSSSWLSCVHPERAEETPCCGVLGYCILSSWCGVEVQINRSGSKGGVLGVPSPGL